MSGHARAMQGVAMLALTAAAAARWARTTTDRRSKRPRASASPRAAPSAASIADLPWWEVFRDDALQALLRRALVSNFDLRIAVARVEQSRALARLAGAKLLPGIGVTATRRVLERVDGDG